MVYRNSSWARIAPANPQFVARRDLPAPNRAPHWQLWVLPQTRLLLFHLNGYVIVK